jgi:hypothetical protein
VPQEVPEAKRYPYDTDGSWEEKFQTHNDVKPRGTEHLRSHSHQWRHIITSSLSYYYQIGPSAIGMDFAFLGAQHVYGIPEHASSFALKTTKYVLCLPSLHCVIMVFIDNHVICCFIIIEVLQVVITNHIDYGILMCSNMNLMFQWRYMALVIILTINHIMFFDVDLTFFVVV